MSETTEDGNNEPITALEALEAGKPYWEAVAQRNDELIGEMVVLASQLNTTAREARVFRALAQRYRRQLATARAQQKPGPLPATVLERTNAAFHRGFRLGLVLGASVGLLAALVQVLR